MVPKFARLAAIGALSATTLAAPPSPVIAPRPITSVVQLPRFEGDKLPLPPKQSKPWRIPEADIPNKALLAAHALFEQGLADPRGCEYREIDVIVGSVWGHHSIQRTHGWVLPRESAENPAFAVCWNGLVTPVQGVGDHADLSKDIEAQLQAQEERYRQHQEHSQMSFRRHDNADNPGIQPIPMSGVSVCLLLRLGETRAAEEIYRVLSLYEDQNVDDPYLLWATDWLWHAFSRSVMAMNRGDDRLALLGMRQVRAWHSQVETTAKERGFSRQQAFDGSGKRPFVTFLSQASAIQADLKRRAEDNDHLSATQLPGDGGRGRTPEFQRFAESLAKSPTKTLVADLQNIRGRKWGQPGGISWSAVPTMAALSIQGTDAIPQLLEAWESDERLTRTINFGRNFHRSRRVVPVRTAAGVLVNGILENRFESVAEARAFWKENKDRSPAERWYHTLLDDEAGREKWTNAAGNIVQLESVRKTLGGWTVYPPSDERRPKTLRGESLRSKTDPSVMELLTRRAEELSKSGTPGSQRSWSISAACDLALAAARWDAEKAGPLLNAQFDRAVAYVVRSREDATSNRDEDFANDLANLTIARSKQGDQRAEFNDYWEFLKGVDPNRLGFEIETVFEPMWRYPDKRGSRRLADKLFHRGGSAWNPYLQSTARAMRNAEPLSGPMLGSEPFRKHLLEQLRDESRAGDFLSNPSSAPLAEVKRVGTDREDGYYRSQQGWISHELGWGRDALDVEPADPLTPPNGEKISIRVCDVYADAISRAEGMPWFEFYWPMEKREEARQRLIERLEQYGARYAYRENLPGYHSRISPRAVMSFPVLKEPASTKDVAQGRAIFSLDEKRKRRVATDIELPRQARWTTLRDRPYKRRTYNPRTDERQSEIAYDQEGLVWQAEEVLIDGQWRRFYGFVGRHALAKVPAEDIEFIEQR